MGGGQLRSSWDFRVSFRQRAFASRNYGRTLDGYLAAELSEVPFVLTTRRPLCFFEQTTALVPWDRVQLTSSVMEQLVEELIRNSIPSYQRQTLLQRFVAYYSAYTQHYPLPLFTYEAKVSTNSGEDANQT